MSWWRLRSPPWTLPQLKNSTNNPPTILTTLESSTVLFSALTMMSQTSRTSASLKPSGASEQAQLRLPSLSWTTGGELPRRRQPTLMLKASEEDLFSPVSKHRELGSVVSRDPAKTTLPIIAGSLYNKPLRHRGVQRVSPQWHPLSVLRAETRGKNEKIKNQLKLQLWQGRWSEVKLRSFFVYMRNKISWQLCFVTML